MKNRIWKPVVGYEGLYEVSNDGLIKSHNFYRHKEPHIMKSATNKDGYLSVMLSKNNTTKRFLIHRIVAETFIPNPNCLEMVNHKDENRQNNNVENLEWCTRSYNQKYSLKKHPERRMLFYHNFLDKSGNSNSPMLISEARVRTEPIAHLDSKLKIIKIYDNWVEAKKELPFADYNIYEKCKKNLNRKNTKMKNYIRKYKGEIFVFLNDELILNDIDNLKIVEEYKK